MTPSRLRGLGAPARPRVAVALAAATLVFAQAASARAEPRDPDPWFGKDKALHFGVSALIACGGYAFGTQIFDDYAGPVVLGSGLALGAGVLKESLDLAGAGDPSLRDLTWDVMGTAVGVGVSVLVHAASGGPRGSATAPSLDKAKGAAAWIGPIRF